MFYMLSSSSGRHGQCDHHMIHTYVCMCESNIRMIPWLSWEISTCSHFVEHIATIATCHLPIAVAVVHFSISAKYCRIIRIDNSILRYLTATPLNTTWPDSMTSNKETFNCSVLIGPKSFITEINRLVQGLMRKHSAIKYSRKWRKGQDLQATKSKQIFFKSFIQYKTLAIIFFAMHKNTIHLHIKYVETE